MNEWYTFGQLLMRIRLGEQASTPDGRVLIRTPDGLRWKDVQSGGTGKFVEIRDYLFSDLWRIDPAESVEWLEQRERKEQLEREMLENQYEEIRAAMLQDRRERK